MGTLTAGLPRLADHCPHKLATSCRLTSTLNCCACADNRPHSFAYRVYVDGVGFVQRGTRWQNYCWFCKTFWDNRVAAASLAPSQTHIPETPDQTEFLSKWFEFHQGFRVVSSPDGEDQRIAVTGEPLKDVSPGELPRTLAQLRAGAQRDLVTSTPTLAVTTDNATENQQSLDDAFDQLLEDAEEEEEEGWTELATPLPIAENVTPQPPPLQPPVRPRLAPSMSGGLRAMEMTDRLRSIGVERNLNQDASPRPPVFAAESPQAAPATGLNLPQDRLAARAARFARVWGTREEFESPDYVSPVAGMFNNAWARHRNVQELRQAQREANQSRMDEILSTMSRDNPAWYMTPRAQTALAESLGLRGDGPPTPDHNETRLAAIERRVHQMLQEQGTADDDQSRTEALNRRRAILNMIAARDAPDAGPRYAGLDGDDRPAPLDDEQLMVKLECKVCLTQKASVACLPCGHLVMCNWCAEQLIPPHRNDRTTPADRNAQCPMCRKRVKQRVRATRFGICVRGLTDNLRRSKFSSRSITMSPACTALSSPSWRNKLPLANDPSSLCIAAHREALPSQLAASCPKIYSHISVSI